eukprot:Hpha_TRINITY_DN12810_c0_g1::TRINITY_DN12810_c0_g1_i2::g.24101::m.24101
MGVHLGSWPEMNEPTPPPVGSKSPNVDPNADSVQAFADTVPATPKEDTMLAHTDSAVANTETGILRRGSDATSGVNRRITDSIARLHAELGRAREQQLEAQRLLAQASADSPQAPSSSYGGGGTVSLRTPRSAVSPGQVRPPVSMTLPEVPSESAPCSAPAGQPSPRREIPNLTPFSHRSVSVASPVPGAEYNGGNGGVRHTAPRIVFGLGRSSQRSVSQLEEGGRRSHSVRSHFSGVQPRYLDPRRPPSPRQGDSRQQQRAGFMAEHVALSRHMGFAGASPRIYQAAEIHAARARERRAEEASGRSPSPRPRACDANSERQREAVMEQHAKLSKSLGYSKIRTKVYDSPFAGLALPSPSPSAAVRRSSSVMGRRSPSASAMGRRSPTAAGRRSASVEPRKRSRSSSVTGARRRGGSAQRRSTSNLSGQYASPARDATLRSASPRVAPLYHGRSPLRGRSADRHGSPPRCVGRPVPSGASAAVRASWRGNGSAEEEALLLAADALEREGKHHDAEQLHIEVLKLRRATKGMTSDNVTASFLGLATLGESAGMPAAAENYFREALQTCLRMHNEPRHADARRALRGQARSLLQLRRCAEALPKCQLLLEMARERYASDNRRVCEARRDLATALNGVGRESEASELRRLNETLGFDG